MSKCIYSLSIMHFNFKRAECELYVGQNPICHQAVALAKWGNVAPQHHPPQVQTNPPDAKEDSSFIQS